MSTAVMEPGQGAPKTADERRVFAIAGLFAIVVIAAVLLIVGLGTNGDSPKSPAPVAPFSSAPVTGSSVEAPPLPAQTATGGLAAGQVDRTAGAVTGSSVAAQATPTAVYNGDERDVALPAASTAQVASCATDGSSCWQPSIGYVTGVKSGATCDGSTLIWRVVGQSAGQTRLACS